MLFDNSSISSIIRKSVTTKADIEKLCRKLNIDVHIDWIDNYNTDYDCQIMNIDADHIGGSHWIAIYKDYYYDPLGLPIARDWLKHLQYTYIDIQDYHHGGCGLYCCLFLYYASNNDIDGFYALFT